MTTRAVAVATNRTVYLNRVKSVSDGMAKSERVIKRSTNVKLGKSITRGKFTGMPMFTVTLEERATCSTACVHYDNCYGNNMMFATRYTADGALLEAMQAELAVLQAKHPQGFMVRLHVLGDFYSVAYVAKWAAWLTQFPALHVYGYTHHAVETEVGGAVATLSCDRWRVRHSGALTGFTAVSEDQPEAVQMLQDKVAFVCPVQTDKVSDCGACSMCWSSTKAVVFLTH